MTGESLFCCMLAKLSKIFYKYSNGFLNFLLTKVGMEKAFNFSKVNTLVKQTTLNCCKCCLFRFCYFVEIFHIKFC